MGIDLQFMLVVLVTCTIFGVMSQYKTPFPPSFIFGGMDASLSRGVASAVFFAACLLLPFEKLSALFRVAISLVAMGAIVLTVALFEGQLEVPGRVLVSLGYAGFDILIWCLIAFFAQRSRNITVSVAAAMGVEQVGILLGAIIVLLLQNTGIGPLAFSIVLMVLTYALLLACFALLGRYLKGWPTFSLPRESSASHGDGAKDAVEELAHVCGLTPREKDVALLLCEGRSAPYIAEKLFVSENTVKTHVRHIYEKGDFHNRQEFLDAMKAKRMQK